MIKILIYIAAWQRRDITRICYEGVKRLQAYKPDVFDINCLVVWTDFRDEALANEYGFRTIYAPNLPLGRKFNTGLEKALSLDFDYLLQLGSDDLLANEALDKYLPFFKKNTDIIALMDLAFVESGTKTAKWFDYQQVIGGGRAIHRRIIEDKAIRTNYRVLKSFTSPVYGAKGKGEIVSMPIGFKDKLFERIEGEPFVELWPPDINIGLDSASEKQLAPNTKAVIAAKHPLLVDIKSETNIHKWDAFPADPYKFELLLNWFSELEKLK